MSLSILSREQNHTVVLLHGWGASARVWDALIAQLAETWRMLAYDLPGYGAKACPAKYDLDSLTELMLDDAPERALWLGWSLGGLIAVNAAARFPKRVCALVLIATNPCFTRRRDWSHAVDPEELTGFETQLRQDPGATLRRFAALQAHGGENRRTVTRSLREASLAARNVGALIGGLRLLTEVDVRDKTAKISCPVLFLLGEHDVLVPRQVSPLLTKLMPNSSARTETIRGAGHAPFLSHPLDIARHIRAFLDERL